MGEEGVPPLVWALTNRDEHIRRYAVQAIESTTAKLDAAVPALEAASRDTDWVVRGIAATTLEALKTSNPLYTKRQGWLRTGIYGNGSYEF
jgi:HEAT repeat protein